MKKKEVEERIEMKINTFLLNVKNNVEMIPVLKPAIHIVSILDLWLT
jgi:hypothetical protein